MKTKVYSLDLKCQGSRKCSTDVQVLVGNFNGHVTFVRGVNNDTVMLCIDVSKEKQAKLYLLKCIAEELRWSGFIEPDIERVVKNARKNLFIRKYKFKTA